ncbi:MAG: MFS transporter [Clostridiales bacterium]|nr:MFS transporter [Clostridiales bacterium]
MKNNKKSIFSSLRSFLALWGSQSVSSMGTAMTEYALIVWSYGQRGSASSVTLLTLSSFLPTILFRFLAGAIADRWDKKRIMLLADFVAACGTVVIFALHSASMLQIWHLYVINFLLSLMNSFQVPAAYVATSLLVPKEHYTRTGGLQSISGAIVSILSPALGGLVLARGGLAAVLVIDLCTFAVALLTLVFLPIPKPPAAPEKVNESFWQNCLSGIKYLRQHRHLMKLTMFIAAVNLLAKLGPDGLMPAFILSRTNGSETTLGLVQAFVAIGIMAGGMILALSKAETSSIRAVFLACVCIFLTGMGLSLSRSAVGWCLFAFLQYLCAAVMNIHWGTIMRTEVPLALQGRVFSARDTLQNITIPAGLYLGGVLADAIFEPLMNETTAIGRALLPLLGGAGGAGIAFQFLLVSGIGFVLSLVCLSNPGFQPTRDASKDGASPEE